MLLSSVGPATAQVFENEPPTIVSASVSPATLPHQGGTVTVSAVVVDDVGVSSVYAEVVGPDSTRYIELASSDGSTFTGQVVIGPNFTDSSVNYSVFVGAEDTNGETAYEGAGDIEVDAQPQFDEAPAVSDPSVEPRELPSVGGPVTIEVTATDNRGISEAYAEVTLPDGGGAYVPLEPISASRFRGFFDVPANTTAESEQYSFLLTALDDIGQSGSVDGGVVTVAPAVPDSKELQVQPAGLDFGQVEVRKQQRLTVTLRNAGEQGSGSIAGVVQAPRAPFALSGNGRGDIPFELEAGESRILVVRFRPTSPGNFVDELIITTADQQEERVALSGTGVQKPRTGPPEWVKSFVRWVLTRR